MPRQRLVETAELTIPVRVVPRDEIFIGTGKERRHLITEDRDCERVIKALSKRTSPGTSRTYAPWIRSYWTVCAARNEDLHDLALFRGWVQTIASESKPATVRVAVASITALLTFLNRPDPKDDAPTRAWLRGILREIATPPKQAAPILISDLKDLLNQARSLTGVHHLKGLRDAAILLLGWTCAMRRSELAALTVADLIPADANDLSGDYLVIVRSSKTDQKKQGTPIPLYRANDPDLDANTAVTAYLNAAGITAGPIFRKIERTGTPSTEPLDERSINWILKQYRTKSGVSAHSLRSGFVTQAALQGHDLVQIQMTTRHKSLETVKRYLRAVDAIQQGTGPLV